VAIVYSAPRSSRPDSQETFEAFGQRLKPILAEVGIDPGTPEILDTTCGEASP
jgi:hypothetical protein